MKSTINKESDLIRHVYCGQASCLLLFGTPFIRVGELYHWFNFPPSMHVLNRVVYNTGKRFSSAALFSAELKAY